MKTICLYFQVHQPLRLKTYRFFNMGLDHNYLDVSNNRMIMQNVASECYLPMNNILLEMIEKYKGAFKITFSISGLAIEQFRSYAPAVLDSFRALAATGCVEFLAETYSHSLSSLVQESTEFEDDVKLHMEMIESEFGVKPTAFRNTELIYSDKVGERVAAMGFKTMVTEGAKHVMGWKSPNFVYANANNQKLHLMLRNYRLSNDIAFNFSNKEWAGYPLTADTYVNWINDEDSKAEVVNIFLGYDIFGLRQKANTGIFDFIKAVPELALQTGNLEFATVSEASKKYQPVGVLYCPDEMSWTDEERDITAWFGNELQTEAFSKLYALEARVKKLNDDGLNYVWQFMQASDHFYYMATKWLSDGSAHRYTNPYDSSYAAFINYMNVLSDFEIEIDKAEAKAAAAAELVEA